MGGGVQTKPCFGQRHKRYMQLHMETTASVSVWPESKAKAGSAGFLCNSISGEK